MPDDPTFNQKDNKYEIAPYKKICGEFGIDPSTDFRFTHGKNHGLGNVYIWVTYSGPRSTNYNYPDPDLALFDDKRVTDRDDPNCRANGIYFVRNDQGADKFSGGAIETQKEFLDRIEDSIILKNISDSIQRYQEAIADTKTRLDFAVAKGVSLFFYFMPSRMVINTESIVGYNNMLMIAKLGMKLGVNNDVNRET